MLMSMLKKFLEFINEEYDLVVNAKENAFSKSSKKSSKRIPYLEDHSILALADNKHGIFAELVVNGNNIDLMFGDDNKPEIEKFNFHAFRNIFDLVDMAHSAWLAKIAELNIDQDVLIDEMSK